MEGVSSEAAGESPGDTSPSPTSSPSPSGSGAGGRGDPALLTAGSGGVADGAYPSDLCTEAMMLPGAAGSDAAANDCWKLPARS